MTNIYMALGDSLALQYYDMGKMCRKSISQVNEYEPSRLTIAKRVLENVLINPDLKVFRQCFLEWCRGAGISNIHGMYLLADNTSGCQSMMVRYKSGLAMLHTEEDYDDIKIRMSGVHTVAFNDRGRVLKSLIYNDLMPGAGLFGWQNNQVICVDSLCLREDGIERIKKPMLANIIAWIIWHTDLSQIEPQELVTRLKKLGTVVDGYAINVIRRVNALTHGYKITFARDEWEVEEVGDSIGDNLRQVNIIDPSYTRLKRPVAKWRHAPWKMYIDYHGYLKRLRDMKTHIKDNIHYLNLGVNADNLREIHEEIQHNIFVKYKSSYITEWMGAACVGLLGQTGLSVSTRLNIGGKSQNLEYIDILI